MVSIIVAVHNHYAMNRLFLEHLKLSSRLPYELIVIDNCSSDGSAELYERVGARVLRNQKNYSYPFCMNQGIRVARGDRFAFLNNDIILSRDWDARSFQIMEQHGLDVASPTATDRVETVEATRKLLNRWKAIRNPIRILFGSGYRSLHLMHRLMYGSWEKYTEGRFKQFGTRVREGIAGCAVLMTRRALDLVGEWDESVPAADFDLALRTKDRSVQFGDLKPAHLILGVFVHHFIRLTLRGHPSSFADETGFRSIAEKWGKERANQLLTDAEMFV
jgi:GT2 family glycosyltransferase